MKLSRTVILVLAAAVLIITGILAYNRIIPSLVARSVLLAVPMGCITGGQFLNRQERANR